MYIILKFIITAIIIVFASEVAKTSDKFWALIVSLPLMTLLTMIWIHLDGGWKEKISNHAYYTFWYVIPTLPMFIIFPFLNEKLGFWIALWLSCIITVVIFFPYAYLLKQFWINLIP